MRLLLGAACLTFVMVSFLLGPLLLWFYFMRSGFEHFQALQMKAAADDFAKSAAAARILPSGQEKLVSSLNFEILASMCGGQYLHAEKALDEWHDLCGSWPGHDPEIERLRPKHIRAGLNRRQGKYDRAITLYDQCLETIKRKQGINQEYISTLLSRSILDLYMGHYERAQAGFTEVAQFQSRNLQTSSFDKALLCINLGRLQEVAGEYAKAELLYTQGLDLLKPIN